MSVFSNKCSHKGTVFITVHSYSIQKVITTSFKKNTECIRLSKSPEKWSSQKSCLTPTS